MVVLPELALGLRVSLEISRGWCMQGFLTDNGIGIPIQSIGTKSVRPQVPVVRRDLNPDGSPDAAVLHLRCPSLRNRILAEGSLTHTVPQYIPVILY